jgi:phosphatidylglycerophosphate synthase
MTVHAILLLASTFYFLFTYQIEIIGISTILTFCFFYLRKYFKDKKTDFLFEKANLVTGFRLFLSVALLFIPFTFFQITIIAFLVLVLDGLDGFLARKYKTESVFGEYLDMETDAVFVLVLSCLLYQNGVFGPWILSLGLLRYLYFLALLFFKPSQQKEARVFRARLIAVILMSSLIAAFALPLSIAKPAIVISALLVFYSFGMSFWNVLKQSTE